MDFIKNDLFEGIVSKAEFEELSKSGIIDKDNTVLIVSHDPNQKLYLKAMYDGFADVIQLKYYDVEVDFVGLKKITQEQGFALQRFIIKNKDRKFFLVCNTGNSRSAAIGAAIECLVNHNGSKREYDMSKSEIASFDRYKPNLAVFEAISEKII